MRVRSIFLVSSCVTALWFGGCGEDGASGSDGQEADGGGDGSDGAGDDGGTDGSDDGDGRDGDGDGGDGKEDAGADGGDEGGELPSLDDCLADVTAKETDTELLTFEADGLAVAVVRYVDPDGFGTSGTTAWLPERFAFAQDGDAVCVTDADKLAYVGSHHNFDDKLTADAGERTYLWTQQRGGYGDPAAWKVGASGTGAFDPTALTLVSCRLLNDDSDCSERYGVAPSEDDDGDGSDGEEAPSVDACLAEAISQGFRTELLTFEAEGLSVALVRSPDPDMFGTSGTTVWLAQRFAFASSSASLCVTESDDLAYNSGYHNFDDKLTVTASDAVYTWTQKRDGYGSPTKFALSATSGESTVLEPVELTLVSCRDLSDDRDCKDYYLNLGN